jgi:hypothetical protein
MRLRTRLSMLLVATAAAFACFAAPGAAATKLPPNFFGIDSVHEPPANEFGLMANTGAEVFRIAMSWRRVEPQAPIEVAGQTIHTYDWTQTDQEVRRASQFGLKLHAGLIDTPSWIAADGKTTPVISEEGAEGWSDFVAAVVDRYGRGGSFWEANPTLPENPPITYQVWNEQNTDGRYLPKPDPREYAEVFTRAGEAIRAAEPGAQILPGGMFGTPQTELSIDAWDFIRILLAQPGVAQYMDGVGVHPYSPDLRGVRFQLKIMRKQLDKLGYQDMPLQVTELGWSSSKSDRFYFFKGPKGQARMLKKSFKLIISKQRRWNIQRVTWFSWRDVHSTTFPGCVFCGRFGLLKEDLTRKPAYFEYRKLALGSSGRKK